MTKSFLYRRFGNYLTVYFFIGIIILGIILFSMSQILIYRLRAEYNKTSTAYAVVLSMLISSKIPQATDKLTKDIGDTMAFPVILTDVDGKFIEGKNLDDDVNPATIQGQNKINRMLKEMDSENEPIPVISYRMNPNTKELEKVVQYYFHYMDPEVLKWLRLLPFAQIILIATFFLIGILTYRNIKRDEQVALWVGMAKETAHQIGTPVSSLMGWLELLNEYNFEGLKDDEKEVIEEAIENMSQDIQRLKRISDRFASIGSRPVLKKYKLSDIVKKAVHYARERLPFEQQNIELIENYITDVEVMANPEQISWCIENLFRNSIRSLEGKDDGKIEITVDKDETDKRVKISIEDNGIGMDRKVIKYLFIPGFTTKKTGWGMGLSLVKRIIVDYHQGEIKVESEVGEGSLFILEFPVI
jgi:hypothetical protein